MFLRLAFSISTAVQPDIVVMDEMIGTGDENFIRKAQRRIDDLLERTRILVLASHSQPIIRRFCNKVLWLEQGRVKMVGCVDDVLLAYERAVLNQSDSVIAARPTDCLAES
jgi:ABC-type polysaccharide/polyol phosphate transport system ATPase subunit